MKKKPHNWAAIIIVALVCVLGGTAFAVSDLGDFIFHSFSGGQTKGYSVKTSVQRFARKDFKGEVLEVEGFIRRQIAEYEPYMSNMPTNWWRQFDSLEKVVEYLGLEALKNPEWYLQEKTTTLSIIGNAKGKFERISIESYYEEDGIRMQAYAYIMTEYTDDDEMILNHITDENHLSATYTNENGNECMLVGATTNTNGYWTKDGYVVSDGILYEAHVVYQSGQEKQAIDMLRAWLDRY